MKNYKLGDMELEFANLIWENEPISSGGLVQLCEQKFSWKKSTTYTMLKRLWQCRFCPFKTGVVYEAK